MAMVMIEVFEMYLAFCSWNFACEFWHCGPN